MNGIENILFGARCNTISLHFMIRISFELDASFYNNNKYVKFNSITYWRASKNGEKVYPCKLKVFWYNSLLLVCFDIYYLIYSFLIFFFLSSLNFITIILIVHYLIHSKNRAKYISLAINICTVKKRIKNGKRVANIWSGRNLVKKF